MVNLDPLGIGETGMIDQEAVAEYGTQAVGELRGKGYLRHQIEDLLALTQVLLDEVNINLRLARRGNPKKQTNGMGLPCGTNGVRRVGLRR